VEKRKNAGFTLIELIVVIAILGILAGAATYSIGAVSSNRAKKFAYSLDAMLSECRVDTLSGSPSPTYLKLSYADGRFLGTLYEGGSEKSSEVFGGSGLTCTFTAGSASAAVGETQSLCLGFSRSTGAFLPLEDVTNGGTAVNGTLSGDCTLITVASGAGSYVVTLVPNTGYHSVGR